MKILKLKEEVYNSGSFKQYCTVEWDESCKSILEPSEVKGRYKKAICGCCECNYAQQPSQNVAIRDNGYCDFCALYHLGKIRYIVKLREATVEEIEQEYNKHPNSSSKEVGILLRKIKELTK